MLDGYNAQLYRGGLFRVSIGRLCFRQRESVGWGIGGTRDFLPMKHRFAACCGVNLAFFRRVRGFCVAAFQNGLGEF